MYKQYEIAMNMLNNMGKDQCFWNNEQINPKVELFAEGNS